MKRIFSTILIVLALLALSTGTVFAGSAMELLEVRNDGAGPTFIFRVIGEFSRSELESGFVHVNGGDDLPLYCAQTDATTVVCHTPKKAGGKDVVVGFGNARFWVFVPETRRNYCYSVWDWWDFTNYQWTNFGPICQEEPANAYDASTYDIPEQGIYDAPVIFYDYNVSGNCTPPVPYDGPAYYHPSCP
jgi:hypothetical protein